ncbi:MAG: tetratricopeptide repeat protein [Leptolyngbyaceae cyanobacterium MO_188.B28]|nr:tetratricopeptide repeat protein [Leptolyngbyaceae cyanobacterium MO_188.B28]
MAVTKLTSRKILGLNQRTYQQLKLTFSLNLRRQLLIAVCDDIVLQKRLATQLEADLTELLNPYDQASAQEKPENPSSTFAKFPKLAHLVLNPERPDLPTQIVQWVKQHRPPQRSTPWRMPDFQILGVEQLTRQPAAVQRRFLDSLQRIEALLPRLDSNLLLWLPWPWFRTIQQSAPEFWRYHSGVFEFAGEPTPVTAIQTSMDTLQHKVAVPVSKYTHQAVPTKAVALTQSRPPKSISKTVTPVVLRPPLPPGETSVDAKSDQSDLWDILTEDLAKLDRQPGQAAPPAGKTSSQTAIPKTPPKSPQKRVNARPGTAQNKASNQAIVYPPQARRPAPPPVSGHPNPAAPQIPPNPRIVPAAAKSATPAAAANGAKETAPPTPVEKSKAATHLPDLAAGMEPRLLSLLQRIERLQQQQAAPTALANAYLALGQLYRDRIEAGEHAAEILEGAIQAYVQGLSLLPKESFHWRDSVNDLGSLYWLKAQQAVSADQAVELMGQSIKTYQKALANPHAPNQPDTIARLQSNLGAAYSVLANYQEPAKNLEQAVRAYHHALQYRRADTIPLEYSSLQNSLGTAYWKLAQYNNPRQNLHQAIAAYNEALPYRQPHQEPLAYAKVQNNLGIAYWSLAQHERPVFLLGQAISAYRNALAYRTLDADPGACAATHNNLGTAYWELANQQSELPEQQLKLWEQAIVAYDTAIKAAQRCAQSHPSTPLNFDLSATHHSLGVVYDRVAACSFTDKEVQQTSLQHGLNHHLQALQGWRQQPDAYGTAFRSIVNNVRLHYHHLGISGQQQALSQVPAELLPNLLPKL